MSFLALYNRYIELLRLGSFLIVVALACSVSHVFARLDTVVYDMGWRLSPHPHPKDVVIVAIDETSLAQYGRWPWSRGLDAQLIRAVCHAQATEIGVDIAFVETGQDVTGNRALQSALADCGHVVLPVLIEPARLNGQNIELLPIAELSAAAQGLGRVGVVLDADGVARSVHLWEGVGQAVWPLMSAELLPHTRLPASFPVVTPRISSPALSTPYALLYRDTRYINYAGIPGAFPRISAAQVLNSLQPLPVFKNKIVLIGATAMGLGDVMATPSSMQGAPMSGVEVLANILVNQRDQHFLVQANWPWVLILNMLMAILPVLWLPRQMPLLGLLSSSLWVLVLLLGAAVLPFLTGVIIPMSGAIFAALLAYPFWSWRRLELARKHLDAELIALQQMRPHHLPLKRLSFEDRIIAVQSAHQQLQSLVRQRDDMLAFITHDIRVPLAGAMQQLQAGQIDKNRLVQQLGYAHGLAQGYLNLSRAMAMTEEKWQPVDVVAVFDQALDSFYAAIQAKQIKVVRSFPEQPVWVMGDFGLLERALMNVLGNAIEYTPSGLSIHVAAQQQGRYIHLSVQDSGPGIAPEDMARLFQRYQSGIHHRANSTGLGLFFVHTVIDKHQGEIRVSTAVPHGAIFTVILATVE